MLRPLHRPRSTSSSNPPTSDDARPYMFIQWKLFEVPEAYPKGAKGRLVNDKRFIQELEELLAKDIRNACARNTNPHAKPKASDAKSDLIYKRVFADFLKLAPRHYGCMRKCGWPEVTGLRWYRWLELCSRWPAAI